MKPHMLTFSKEKDYYEESVTCLIYYLCLSFLHSNYKPALQSALFIITANQKQQWNTW